MQTAPAERAQAAGRQADHAHPGRGVPDLALDLDLLRVHPRAAGDLLADLAVLRARRRQAAREADQVLRRPRLGARRSSGSCSATSSSCPRRLALPARLRQRHLHQQPPGASRSSPSAPTSCWRWRSIWELPLFVVGLTRLGIMKTDKLRKNRRIGYFLVACLAVALPGVDPVTVTLETLPLMILFECSIWLSVLLDRRSARMRERGRSRRDGGLRRLGAPGRRPAAERRARRLGGRAHRRGRSRPRRAPLRRRGDPAGPRQRALAPRVRRLRRLRRRPACSATGSASTSRASARSRTTRWSRSPGAAPPTRSRPGSPRRPTTASPAPPRRPRPSSGSARSSTSRCSAPTRTTPAPVRGDAPARDRRASSSGSASRRTRRTPARSTSTAGASRSASRSARTSPRAPAENEWLASGTGPLAPSRSLLVEPTGQRAVATLADVLGPELLCAHCVHLDGRRDRPARPPRRARRPLPALERAARLRHRAARRAARRRASASASEPTRRRRRRRSTPGRSCAPPST